MPVASLMTGYTIMWSVYTLRKLTSTVSHSMSMDSSIPDDWLYTTLTLQLAGVSGTAGDEMKVEKQTDAGL